MMRNIILVGNPNTGKTTLFNSLTKSNEKASNWHGVTVGLKTKKIYYKNNAFNVTDIPGLYSLNPYSPEEKIAVDYLKMHKNDLIINLCDANNIKRNLLLTIDLINAGFDVMMVVNMHNEICLCDYMRLSNKLGVQIIPLDARNNKHINKLKSILYNYSLNKKSQNIKKYNIIYNNIIKNKMIFNNNTDPYKINDKIDKIVLNKLLFIPIFLTCVFLIFYITFGDIGIFINDLTVILLNKSANIIKILLNTLNISEFIKDFINIAVVDTCFSIASFIPQIVLLMFFINLLEDIGLMSRFAFMFDGLLKKIGLTGKSLFSMFMGFGCSTTSILSTRNLENSQLRKRTISLIPFVPCSAKLPIFLVIASLFFEKHKYLFVFAIYIFSIIILILVAILFSLRKDEDLVFVIEMPKYRVPNIKKITKDVFCVIKEFLLKITKVIVLFSIIVWILQNLSLKFDYLKGENFNQSILYFIGSKLKFLFMPIGLDNVGVVVSLILGLCAKELIVVGLCVMNGVGSDIMALTNSLLSANSVCYFSLNTALVFLIFILLYSPCVSALSSICNEVNKKFAIKLALIQFGLAYLVSFIVSLCLNNYNFIYLVISILVSLIIMKFMLKSNHKIKICQGVCDACRKI